MAGMIELLPSCLAMWAKVFQRLVLSGLSLSLLACDSFASEDNGDAKHSSEALVVEKIAEAMVHRLSVFSNIEFSAKVLRVFDDYDHAANERQVDLIWIKESSIPKWSLRRVTQKRLAGSYLSSIFKDGVDGTSEPNTLYCKNWYDAMNGVNKGYAGFGEGKDGDGRVSTKQDSAELHNVVNCLFGRTSSEYHMSLYECIGDLLRSENLTSSTDESRTELKSIRRQVGRTGRVVTWTKSVVFETQKAFAPISMVCTHEMDWLGLSLKDAIFMSDMSVLGDIYVPRHAKVLRDSTKDGKAKPAAVCDIKIDYEGSGHLTIGDLSYEYPPGTVVVDELAQGAYVAQLGGLKRALPTPIGFGALPEGTRSANSGWVMTFILVNAVTLLLIGSIVLLRKWMERFGVR